MDRLSYMLVVACVIVIESKSIIAIEPESITLDPIDTITTTVANTAQDNEDIEQRSISSHADGEIDLPLDNADHHAAFRKRAKPLKSIFMGIYRNYKSTYLGNKTLAEYKRTLRTKELQNDENAVHGDELVKVAEAEPNHDKAIEPNDTDDIKIGSTEASSFKEQETLAPETKSAILETKSENTKKKRKKQRARKRNHRRKKHEHRQLVQVKKLTKNASEGPIYNYDFGPTVNMSLDLNNEIVKLNLDGKNLQNILQGRWLKEGNEGRGKKYDMITKVLPLFIIPFLIQSAVVPFLVTKLKLLLMKSILVGKLAIFLLVISAIRNSNKGMQTYEVAPSYWAGEPSRRSELTAAATAAAYNGYRVEGKPTAWIN